LGILWARCVWLQVLAAPRYAAIARSQYQARQTLQARRGAIVDRHGRILAISIPAPSVFANARDIPAKREMAQRLASVVGQDARMI